MTLPKREQAPPRFVTILAAAVLAWLMVIAAGWYLFTLAQAISPVVASVAHMMGAK